MANEVQLRTDIGTLAPKPNGETRQQYAEELVKRLLVYLPSTNATFKIGGAQPTSDDGPWFKEVTDPKSGNSSYELWVWSSTAATYVPLTLNQTQLRYYVGTAAPSQTVYDVWFKVNSNGKLIGVHTYNSANTAWEPVSYTIDEIDNLFEPTVAGKKQVDWGNVVNIPPSALNSPRALSGALVPADALYDWEQVYHMDCGQMLVYDASNSLWKTVTGGVGDIKIVSGPLIGTTGHFLAGDFSTILGKNPGWDLDTSSQGRAIVGALPTEVWDITTPLTKNAGSTYGYDDFVQSIAQMPAHTHPILNWVGDGITPMGYGDSTPGTGHVTESTGNSEDISLVQKSIAYYIIRKIL